MVRIPASPIATPLFPEPDHAPEHATAAAYTQLRESADPWEHADGEYPAWCEGDSALRGVYNRAFNRDEHGVKRPFPHPPTRL